jgi:hypothetical protein
MKKIIITAAALAAIAPSVYASKARILALGDAVEDNYFVEDSRRIFTNPAHIHNYKNQVFLEWGENGAAAGGALDSDDTPKAMGGFLMESGNLVYGAYLGNESNISSSLRIIASDIDNNTGQAVLPTADNQIDLFVGGDMGSLKWGADFIYTAADRDDANKVKSEDSAMALKTGVQAKNWEAFLNLSLNSESEVGAGYISAAGATYTNAQKFDGKFGIQLGGVYKLNNGAEAFVAVKKFDWEHTVSTTKTDGGLMSYRLGYGKKMKAGNGLAFARAYYENIAVELERNGLAKAELKNSLVPVVFGYEAQATSWLTLRGSVKHNLIGTAEGKQLSSYLGTFGNHLQAAVARNYNGTTTTGYLNGKQTIANSTEVNAGASLNFGKLTVDGFVGTTAGSRTGNNNTKNGVFATDNLLTRVGMTYAF